MKALLLLVLFSATVSCSGCRYPEGSDGYYIGKISKEHPTWGVEKCEDYLFMPKDSFIVKYK